MIIYLVRAIADFAFTLVAYLTNPIVVLFANEYGELPKVFKLWQTYDNPLDVRFIVYEVMPDMFRYDFDKHYIYHNEQKGTIEEFKKGWVDLIDPDFTLKERFQRYCCRVRWLYRNAGYGFSYYVNGFTHNAKNNIPVLNKNEWNDAIYFSYYKTTDNKCLQVIKTILAGKFCFWVYKKWCSRFCIRVYLGWKMKYQFGVDANYRNMLALHVNPFRSSD